MPPIEVVDEVGNGCAECLGKSRNVEKADIPFTAFQAAHIRSMKVRPLREVLLGESPCQPTLPDRRAKRAKQCLVGVGEHGATLAR
jgi:hypothetical protein